MGQPSHCMSEQCSLCLTAQSIKEYTHDGWWVTGPAALRAQCNMQCTKHSAMHNAMRKAEAFTSLQCNLRHWSRQFDAVAYSVVAQSSQQHAVWHRDTQSLSGLWVEEALNVAVETRLRVRKHFLSFILMWGLVLPFIAEWDHQIWDSTDGTRSVSATEQCSAWDSTAELGINWLSQYL